MRIDELNLLLIDSFHFLRDVAVILLLLFLFLISAFLFILLQLSVYNYWLLSKFFRTCAPLVTQFQVNSQQTCLCFFNMLKYSAHLDRRDFLQVNCAGAPGPMSLRPSICLWRLMRCCATRRSISATPSSYSRDPMKMCVRNLSDHMTNTLSTSFNRTMVKHVVPSVAIICATIDLIRTKYIRSCAWLRLSTTRPSECRWIRHSRSRYCRVEEQVDHAFIFTVSKIASCSQGQIAGPKSPRHDLHFVSKRC